MKILLNGATSGTNFGDYLFAHMFQYYVAEKVGINGVFWYDSKYSYSKFFRDMLQNCNKAPFKEMNGMVYISGGYFCGKDRFLRDYIYRFLSYFKVGLECIATKKPYAIIGVDVAISKNCVNQAIQKIILQKAEVLTVRNKESLEALKIMGIKKGICTADSVFAFPDYLLSGIEPPHFISQASGKKLLLHVNPSKEKNTLIEEKVVPIINWFLKNHPTYDVVIACDQYSKEQREAMNLIADKVVKPSNIVEYSNPLELCIVIKNIDLIVTSKLHVGIVGAKYGKSVVSFSGHSDKIHRLYAQLGEEDRTYPINDLTFDIGCKMMQEYYNKPITIDNDIIKASYQNFIELDKFLQSLKDRYVGV